MCESHLATVATQSMLKCGSGWGLSECGVLLGHLGDTVHVEAGDLLRYHAAHGQLQLQQRSAEAVVLETESSESHHNAQNTHPPTS